MSCKMKIAVIETNESLRSKFSDIITSLFDSRVETETYSSYSDFLELAVGRIQYDILFTNIVLDNKSGVKLAAEYKNSVDSVKLVFYCKDMNMAPDIFETEPYNLLKIPFEKKKIQEIINKAAEEKENEKQQYIGLQNRYGVYCYNLNDIELFESEARELIVYHKAKKVRIYKKLDEIQQQVEHSSLFIRCHQSFLVNRKYILELVDKKIVLRNGMEIPVARNRLAAVREKLLQY